MKHSQEFRIKLPLFILILLAITVSSFIAKHNDPVEKLVKALKNQAEINPLEKVYVHMDKPFYALGDTIWLKTYLTMGSWHKPSTISGAVYVDLINEKDSVRKTLKLFLRQGTANGDFILDDSFTEGNYRIRAYTQWMRNAGEDYFFDHTFSVGNGFGNEIRAGASYKYETAEGKPTVIAQLSYKDESGNPLADKEVKYKLVNQGKFSDTKTARTDKGGNIEVRMANDSKTVAERAYIHTEIQFRGKEIASRDFPVKKILSQSDVQFFPEGGNMVSGLSCRVAFKAVGADGLGVPVKGVVLDNDNKELLNFSAEHAGMGSFFLSPVAGKNYRAKVSFADGSEMISALPGVKPEGYALSVADMDKDSIKVRIAASGGLALNGENLILLAHCGGEVVFSAAFGLKNREHVLRLGRDKFPTGIAQFTLFDPIGIPQCERIAFVKNKDRMKLELADGKKEYKTREMVELELQSLDRNGAPVAGSFSVSVIDEERGAFDEDSENTIFSSLLLTADLKGYVEKPNWYFSERNSQAEVKAAERALDNLMLTQGYRSFVWDKVLKEPVQSPLFKAEKGWMDLAGKALTLGGKPLDKAKVTLLSLNGGVMEEVNTDNAGKFRFEELRFPSGLRFMAEVKTAAKSKRAELILDSVPELPKPGRNKNIPAMNTDIAGSFKAYLENVKKQDQWLAKTGRLNRVQRLKEVKIIAKRDEREKITNQGALTVPEGHADQTYLMEGGEKCPMLWICLQGRLRGVFWKPYGDAPMYPYCNFSTPESKLRDGVAMDVVLDGRKLELYEAMGFFYDGSVDPADIQRIEVVRANLALIGMLTNKPVLLIITKSRKYRAGTYRPNIVHFTMRGFDKGRKFYSPRYEYNTGRGTDLRSTIYWNPVIKTDTEGRFRFDFFNGDNPGTYKVVVEGISVDGELGRQVYRYNVNGKS